MINDKIKKNKNFNNVIILSKILKITLKLKLTIKVKCEKKELILL